MEPAEPSPSDPRWPRYSEMPLPRHRFVPGLSARPRGDPTGATVSVADGWSPEEWRSLTPYLYGVDLYNYAFWWECHEVLEGLWHAAGRTTPPATFVQGIIHLAASHLNRHRGHLVAAERQALRGATRIGSQAGRCYMGIDVDDLVRRVRESMVRVPWEPPLIALDGGHGA